MNRIHLLEIEAEREATIAQKFVLAITKFEFGLVCKKRFEDGLNSIAIASHYM